MLTDSLGGDWESLPTAEVPVTDFLKCPAGLLPLIHILQFDKLYKDICSKTTEEILIFKYRLHVKGEKCIKKLAILYSCKSSQNIALLEAV